MKETLFVKLMREGEDFVAYGIYLKKGKSSSIIGYLEGEFYEKNGSSFVWGISRINSDGETTRSRILEVESYNTLSSELEYLALEEASKISGKLGIELIE